MPHFVSVCNKSLYMEWSACPFFVLETLSLTLPTFYSPVALSKCWSSRGNVLVCNPGPSLLGLASGYNHYPLASPPPKQTTPTHTHILCPSFSTPHDSWPGCCCSLLIQPATVFFIALICSFLSMCGQGARSEWENVHLSERVFGFLCLFVCFFALHFYFVWHCPNKSTLHFLVCVMVKWFTQAMLWSLMALQLTRAMLWISYICLHWWKV